MQGIQYVTDSKGKKVAVQINLRKFGAVWEEIEDALIAESRKNEPTSSWSDVKKRLKLNKPH